MNLYFKLIDSDMLPYRADAFDRPWFVWGMKSIWARGTISQKCLKSAKKYCFALWYPYVSPAVVVGLFSGMMILRGSRESIASLQ